MPKRPDICKRAESVARQNEAWINKRVRPYCQMEPDKTYRGGRTLSCHLTSAACDRASPPRGLGSQSFEERLADRFPDLAEIMRISNELDDQLDRASFGDMEPTVPPKKGLTHGH
jgi:hypothetical protein